MFRIYVKKLIKWAGVPLVLIFIAIALSAVYFFNSDINPNVLSVNHGIKNIQNTSGGVNGTFKAQENYLGIISVRFDKKKSLNGDSLFRIKNILDKDWNHVATIAASQYNAIPLYRFGIPVIAKSKNKTYQFEVHLLDYTTASPSFTLSNRYPMLISQYAYPKNILLENKELLSAFILKKLSYYIFEESSWKVLTIYSIPLVLYVLYLAFERTLQSSEFVKKIRGKLIFIFKPYIFFVFLGIFVDIFIIRKYSDSTTSLFTLLWILGIAAYRLEARYSFGIALIFLTICPFLLSANMEWVAEKSAVWTYMFLFVGTIHAIIKLKASESPKISDFFKNVNVAPSFFTYSISFISTFIKNIRIFILFFFKNIVKIITALIIYTDYFLISCTKNITNIALFSFRNFVKVVISFVIVTALFLVGFDVYLRYMSYRNRQMMNPSVQLIEPAIAYPGTKVVVYGDRFGDNSNNKYALMRDGIRVQTDYWEDHKIIFTIPLDWKKPGVMNIWIEKPVEWNAETVIEKTKPITVKLLQGGGAFTLEDDLYFEQMKKWRKETREMNGYK